MQPTMAKTNICQETETFRVKKPQKKTRPKDIHLGQDTHLGQETW